MRILWFTNIMFPEIGNELNRTISNSGGWMQQFKKAFSNNENFQLAITSFDITSSSFFSKNISGIQFYNIPKKESNAHIYDMTIESYVDKVIEEFEPDIVHIWGSEFPHSLTVAKKCNEKNIKYVISIQGLIFDCARHYYQGIPNNIVNSFTLRDFLRKDNIQMQKVNFEKRGFFEIECIKLSKNIIGRTIYDYSTVMEINDKINYYFCNECLRKSFYDGDNWALNNINRNTIFISQAYYPIKGFHYFLEALLIVKKRKKDVKVFVGGGFNPFPKTKKEKLKQGSYAKYIAGLIKKYDLMENIVFLKNLNEKEMKEIMIKSHLFVSSSLIENSPNSVGEAMILGVPTISSFVGGVSDMIEHNKSGLLYAYDQPSVLAQYIINIFDNDELAIFLSKNARKKALRIYDIETNVNQMKKIYKQILSCVD